MEQDIRQLLSQFEREGHPKSFETRKPQAGEDPANWAAVVTQFHQ